MATEAGYKLKPEMRRLADKLYELTDLYKETDPKLALAALKEARLLAGLGYEVESGGRLGEAAGAALLSIAHQRKINDAIARRKINQLPIEIEVGGENGRTNDPTDD